MDFGGLLGLSASLADTRQQTLRVGLQGIPTVSGVGPVIEQPLEAALLTLGSGCATIIFRRRHGNSNIALFL